MFGVYVILRYSTGLLARLPRCYGEKGEWDGRQDKARQSKGYGIGWDGWIGMYGYY